MIRALAPLCAALACFVIACGSSGDDGATPVATVSVETPLAASCDPARAADPGNTIGTVTSAGIDRTYLLHIPTGYDGTAQTPLVMLFHGFALPADAFSGYVHFNEVADTNGVIVVYPNGQGDPAVWNTAQDVTIANDVEYANDLLDKIEEELCIDPSGIFVAGFSNGGTMAQRVACESPDRIAALATVGAIYADCKAAVPWIAFHGIDDPVVPFEGGPTATGGSLQPARRIISEWARGLGCDGLAQISRPTDAVELSTYVNCLRGSGEVLLYSLIRAGHTWPGAEDLPVDIAGATSKQIDGSSAIWDFFDMHPLAH